MARHQGHSGESSLSTMKDDSVVCPPVHVLPPMGFRLLRNREVIDNTCLMLLEGRWGVVATYLLGARATHRPYFCRPDEENAFPLPVMVQRKHVSLAVQMRRQFYRNQSTLYSVSPLTIAMEQQLSRQGITGALYMLRVRDDHVYSEDGELIANIPESLIPLERWWKDRSNPAPQEYPITGILILRPHAFDKIIRSHSVKIPTKG